MSELLGNARTRVTEALQRADLATRGIYEQAEREAREHHVKALEEAERMTRERITKLTQVAAEVSAQGQALQVRARELAEVIRRSTDSLNEELGLPGEPEPAGPSGAEQKRALEPDSMSGYGAEAGESSTKPPVALRELFGFKRKRPDHPEASAVTLARAQMLVAGYSAKLER